MLLTQLLVRRCPYITTVRSIQQKSNTNSATDSPVHKNSSESWLSTCWHSVSSRSKNASTASEVRQNGRPRRILMMLMCWRRSSGVQWNSVAEMCSLWRSERMMLLLYFGGFYASRQTSECPCVAHVYDSASRAAWTLRPVATQRWQVRHIFAQWHARRVGSAFT